MAQNLVVETVLTAKDAGLSATMEKMSHHAEKFKEKFKEAFTFGSIAGLGAVAGEKLAEGIKEAVKALPEFAEKAEQIGLSAQKVGMTIEAYQKLGYALHQLDIPVENSDKAFKKLNVGLAQLRVHQGPMLMGLKRINPELLKQLSTAKNAQDAFLDVAEAVSKESDATKRAAIAQAVFGKSGQEMLPALLKGKEGLKELTDQADIYGNVIGEDTIKNADKFKESTKQLGAMLTSLKDTALAGLLEGVTPIVGKMSEWLSQNRKFIASGITQGVKLLGDVFAKLGPPIAHVVQVLLPAIGKVFDKLGPVLSVVMDTITTALDALMPALDPLLELFTAITPAITMAADVIRAILVPAFQLLKPIIQGVTAVIQLNMMVWSQTIGRMVELMLQGVSVVLKTLHQDTSGIDGAIKSLQTMRETSTAATLGAIFRDPANDRQGPGEGNKSSPTPSASSIANHQSKAPIVNTQVIVTGVPGAEVKVLHNGKPAASGSAPAATHNPRDKAAY